MPKIYFTHRKRVSENTLTSLMGVKHVKRHKILKNLKYIRAGMVGVAFGIGLYISIPFIHSKLLAASNPYTWDFTSAGDYTVSDSTAVEVAGSSARLKVQEYETDGSTAALYHLNETSGGTSDDASANSNDLTVTDASFNSGGNFNYALAYDGATSRAYASDSASLSMTSSQTLEAWVKLNSTFNATSSSQDKGVIDKGAYKLYFNHNTGKLTYEIEDSSATTWSQVAGNDLNGGWDLNGQLAVGASTSLGSYVYFGLGNQVGDAEVWRLNTSDTTWSKIGGDDLNDGWANALYEQVLSLTNDGTNIYAGLGTTAGDAEVWKYTVLSGTWSKIGGDGVDSSWTAAGNWEGVYALTYFNSNLYAGLGNSANDAEVWMYNGSIWAKIGGDSTNSGWTTGYDYVYSMTNDGTNLYAGLGSSATEAEVWMWNGTLWQKIGGDGANSSWAAASNIEIVYSMTYFGGNLYAGTGNSAGDADVWRYNGTSWVQIGGDGTGWAASTYEGVFDLINDGTNLYAGLGNTAGDNEVYSYNGSWTKIGGDAVNSGFTNTHTVANTLAYNGSTLYAGLTTTNNTAQVWAFTGGTWTLIGGNYVNSSWGFYGLESAQAAAVVGDYMYFGTGNTVAKNALIWQFDGSSWTLVGGQGINSSWAANTYEIVNTAINHDGTLVVGLGTTAGDGEVWQYSGSTWVQLGGDGIDSSWTTGYESVTSMASFNGILYVGLGTSANDAEVYTWDGDTWEKIGGDNTNSGWATNFDNVMSMTVYEGALHVGLGVTAGEAEVWRWGGSTWSKVGGDTVGSSWNSTDYEAVESLVTFNNKLYAGLGNSSDDAEVWEYDGTTWTMIGGDGANSSWETGEMERIRFIRSYNGTLMVGTGSAAGDAEIWRYNGSSWARIGGDDINNSWTINQYESATTAIAYKGKFYVGLGDSANVDASIWAYGNNAYLQSTTASFDTSWHHIAATYDGATAKIYIDGVEDSSLSTSKTLPDTSHDLLIGSRYASGDMGIEQGIFDGLIDEVRISSTARSSFTTAPYSATAQTVSNTVGRWSSLDGGGLGSYSSFSADETAGTGTIRYRLSSDGGTTWKYWDGAAWAVSSNTGSHVNTEAEVNSNIDEFPISDSGIRWQAVLDGDGSSVVSVTNVTINGIEDLTSPEPPTSIAALDTSGGAVILTSNTWYNYTTPYFSWSGASDSGGAGIAGYFVYFGVDDTATPSSAGNFQTAANFSASGMTTNTTYYLRIQTKDKSQRVSTVYPAFIYKLDSSTPAAPGTVTVTPSGYASTNSFVFDWADVTDSTGSGLAGYQYQAAEVVDSGSWSATQVASTLSVNDLAYQIGTNKFHLRTIDNAGNTSSSVEKTFLYGGDGPSAPQFLDVTPETNTTNSFAFTWEAPDTYSGSASELTYCYTVNVLPSSNSCSFTAAGFTSLSASSYATSQGINTMYVVAKNSESSGGAINYANYASVTFTANTSAPGIPLNTEVADVSVKSTSSWKIALSWEEPDDVGSGIDNYQIHHSLDDVTYSEIASTTGIAYVDTGLTQVTHYYKVRACDSVDNCGAFSSSVSLLPTGRFTEAPTLSAEPEVTNITTKKATISWSTDRTSDSKISYGTSSGDYFDEEPSNSDQVTDHTINLTNLKPGTKYYFIAKWTDEDGNTGYSDEDFFETSPAPTVTDPKVKVAGIDNVTLEYTVADASTVKIYYGKTSAFGGTLELSVSSDETTYLTTIDDLEDGTKYYYKINTLDIEDDEYDGSILSFDTLPRPKISDVKVQQVKGTAQPSVLVTWTSNTEISSIITYYPDGAPGSAIDQVDVALVKGLHRMLVKGLQPETPYSMVIRGRDKSGNEASSDVQKLTTATDTRPPLISNMKIEGTITKSKGNITTAQLVVSWDTDEQGTSQIEFGEGTGSNYSQTTPEDKSLTFNHVVVIPELSPSKVYHLRVISTDKANNVAKSIDTVSITPKASDSALNLVITNLQEAFGFLGNFKQQ